MSVKLMFVGVTTPTNTFPGIAWEAFMELTALDFNRE